jgi:glycogen debranching enzyme
MLDANDPKDESRLLYDYGLGRAIGSFAIPPPFSSLSTSEIHASLPPSSFEPHAFLMDITHDNPSPSQKRTAVDALASGALVAIAGCAVGSNRGYDDLFAKGLDLVGETRKYQVPLKDSRKDGVEGAGGIGEVKRMLNLLHTELAVQGYEEGFFSDQGNVSCSAPFHYRTHADLNVQMYSVKYVTGHRINPKTGRGFLLVAHTAFSKDQSYVALDSISLPSTSINYLYGATLSISTSEDPSDATTLIGLPSSLIPIPASSLHLANDPNHSFISVTDGETNFPPGSILVFETQIQGIPKDLEKTLGDTGAAKDAWKECSRVDLNVVLFRSDGEERDAGSSSPYFGGQIQYSKLIFVSHVIVGPNDGSYSIPNVGQLVYCGLQGWKFYLDTIVRDNDLGHGLCEHLRQGTWALDYVSQRLER